MTTNAVGFPDAGRRGPRFGAMIGLVALIVATVIPCSSASATRWAGSFCDGAPSRLARSMGPLPCSGSKTTGWPCGQPAAALPGGHLARAGLLDLRRRPPPDRGPHARGLRHRGVAVPVHRDDRLPDRAPAGVPRRRARARARDRGRPGAAGGLEHHTARTAASRPRRRSCAAPAACAGSRSPAASAASRSTRAGRSAPTARPRWASRPRAAGHARAGRPRPRGGVPPRPAAAGRWGPRTARQAPHGRRLRAERPRATRPAATARSGRLAASHTEKESRWTGR